MERDIEKLTRAKEVLNKMAGGINPLTGEKADRESFLHQEKISRCLLYVTEVLDQLIRGQDLSPVSKQEVFSITPEEKARVRFPDGPIGVNEVARCINQVLDLKRSKKITGVELNKQLKRTGLLDEVPYDGNKTRTALNEKSAQYGLETVKRIFDGVEYDQVVFNAQGKKFLLDNLENILGYRSE